MKFNIEVISPVGRMLSIEFSKEHVKKALDKAYIELKKTVKVKGFRPNKTPRSVLERLYGKDVRKNVSSELIQQGLSEAINKSQLKFISTKKIDPPELNPTKEYKFNAEIEIKPEIGNISFKNLILKKTLYKASDKEVETQLNMLQKSLAKNKPIETNRPIKDKDLVVISYKGYNKNKGLEEISKADNFNIKIGEAILGEEFDNFIKGMEIGKDKDFEILFPNDFKNKKFSGIEVKFEIKIKDIRIEILPEINDDMAKQIGSFKTLQELKNKIFKNLEQGYEKRKEQELYEQIFTQLIEKTKFDLPESMIKYELEAIINDTEQSFKYHNKTLQDAGLSRETLTKQYKKVAQKQVRRQLLLEQIISQENMKISDQELDEGFKEMSLTYNSSIEKIKTFYGQNPEKLESFKHALLEKKAINTILSQNEVIEVEGPEN